MIKKIVTSFFSFIVFSVSLYGMDADQQHPVMHDIDIASLLSRVAQVSKLQKHLVKAILQKYPGLRISLLRTCPITPQILLKGKLILLL